MECVICRLIMNIHTFITVTIITSATLCFYLISILFWSDARLDRLWTFVVMLALDFFRPDALPVTQPTVRNHRRKWVKCFIACSVSQRPNLRHLCELLRGTEGLIKTLHTYVHTQNSLYPRVHQRCHGEWGHIRATLQIPSGQHWTR